MTACLARHRARQKACVSLLFGRRRRHVAHRRDAIDSDVDLATAGVIEAVDSADLGRVGFQLGESRLEGSSLAILHQRETALGRACVRGAMAVGLPRLGAGLTQSAVSPGATPAVSAG